MYTNWLATDGEDLIARWRAGEPITNETDKLYLPLAKTEFWNDMLMKKVPENDNTRWDGSKGYFWGQIKLPDLSKFPTNDRPDHAAYQATLEAGLPVLHKIYNQQSLTAADKALFYDWAIAYYCCYYINGVTPESLPADSWYVANEAMMHEPMPAQGDIFPNVAMYNPEHFWDKPEFSETNYCDVSLHLRAGKTNELLQQYIDFAQYWEPVPGDYPKVQPKFPAADAPDTDEYRTLYNFLKEENKPTLFATWLIDNDEGNLRLTPRVHFLHRIWRHKIGFITAEGSVNNMNEKNDLRFDASENEQYRTHILRCFTAAFMPVPYVSPILHFFERDHTSSPYRMMLLNTSAENLGVHPLTAMNGDFGGMLARILGMDKKLIDCFKNGFNPDPSGSKLLPTASLNSIIPGRMAQCASNGYNITAYSRYKNHFDAIGEIIAVDTNAHTVTLLREEYHDEDYPVLALKDRFPTTYNEFVTRDKGGSAGKFHFDDLAARKAAGNSIPARTLTFNVNVGVCMFLNGDEMPDETCLKVGDVASIVYLDDKGGYPHFIRAIRFNFPPTFGEVANTGAGTAELRGIDDDNLIVDQEITVTAKSSSPSKMPDPIVAYKKGVCTFTYTPPPAGETVDVKVTLKDDGGTDFGGNDATKLTLKFTADGAALVD
ncbi:MAG: hypothetical protein DRH79_08230 [Candidatus Cloacimonadota bacterium]|nr:MAG: hypothetical protein DRH79_08230 [Candidatus Cloacimonadota bacterium]